MAFYFDSNKYLHVLNKTLLLMLLQKQLSPLLYLLYRQLPSRRHLQGSPFLGARCKDAKGRKVVAT